MRRLIAACIDAVFTNLPADLPTWCWLFLHKSHKEGPGPNVYVQD